MSAPVSQRGRRRSPVRPVQRFLLKALMTVAVGLAERGLRRAFKRRAATRASGPGP